MIDHEALSRMQGEVNKAYDKAMGMTLHTETKREFLRTMIEGAKIALDRFGERNFAEEIHRRLDYIHTHVIDVNRLMREHCDMRHPSVKALPEDSIVMLHRCYEQALERDAPLERLAQASVSGEDPFPTPPPLPVESAQSPTVDTELFPGVEFPTEELPF